MAVTLRRHLGQVPAAIRENVAAMTATSGRLLKLLSLLQTRRDWPGSELARRLEVSARTVRRDVERLRELGYPVEASTGPAGGYRLHAGTAMPPLLLDDDEAVAIAVGLRTAAGASVAGIEETSVRALVKLEQVLPAHLRRRVNALQSVTATLAAPGPKVDPEALTVIASALPRPRAAALRVPLARRERHAAARRAALAREPGPALVPRRVGLRPVGLADVPHGPPRPGAAGGVAVRAALAAGRGPGRVRRLEPEGRAAALPGAGHAARPGRGDPRLAVLVGATSSRSTTPRASCARATTRSSGSRSGSGCSAPSSWSTSRRSWPRRCGRSPGGSGAPSRPDRLSGHGTRQAGRLADVASRHGRTGGDRGGRLRHVLDRRQPLGRAVPAVPRGELRRS